MILVAGLSVDVSPLSGWTRWLSDGPGKLLFGKPGNPETRTISSWLPRLDLPAVSHRWLRQRSGRQEVLFAKPGNPESRRLTAALRLARIARPGTHAQQRQVARTDSAVPLMLEQGADGAAPPNKGASSPRPLHEATHGHDAPPPQMTSDLKTVPYASSKRTSADLPGPCEHRRGVLPPESALGLARDEHGLVAALRQVPFAASSCRRPSSRVDAPPGQGRPATTSRKSPADWLRPGRDGRPASRQGGKQAARNVSDNRDEHLHLQAADAVTSVRVWSDGLTLREQMPTQSKQAEPGTDAV
jgi:hypothetical protein